MCKRARGSEGETTPRSDGKRLRRSSPDEEAQKDWVIISVDSPDRVPNDQPTLEGAPNEADASLEEGVPVGGPPNINEIGENAPSGVAATLMLRSRPVNTKPSRKRLPDRLLLSTYVLP